MLYRIYTKYIDHFQTTRSVLRNAYYENFEGKNTSSLRYLHINWINIRYIGTILVTSGHGTT